MPQQQRHPPQLQQDGRVSRGYLGVQIQPLPVQALDHANGYLIGEGRDEFDLLVGEGAWGAARDHEDAEGSCPCAASGCRGPREIPPLAVELWPKCIRDRPTHRECE